MRGGNFQTQLTSLPLSGKPNQQACLKEAVFCLQFDASTQSDLKCRVQPL